jgi:hypothetical protein
VPSLRRYPFTWNYPGGATAKSLIKVVLDNGLIPGYMQTHLASLRQTLEAGLPAVRNKNSGHGQGLLARKIPDYFAGYALHLAATNIVFFRASRGFEPRVGK